MDRHRDKKKAFQLVYLKLDKAQDEMKEANNQDIFVSDFRFAFQIYERIHRSC